MSIMSSTSKITLADIDALVDMIPDYEDPEEELERFWSLTAQQRDVFLDYNGFPRAYVFGSYPSAFNSRRCIIDSTIETIEVKYGIKNPICKILREQLILYSPGRAEIMFHEHMKQYLL